MNYIKPELNLSKVLGRCARDEALDSLNVPISTDSGVLEVWSVVSRRVVMPSIASLSHASLDKGRLIDRALVVTPAHGLSAFVKVCNRPQAILLFLRAKRSFFKFSIQNSW